MLTAIMAKVAKASLARTTMFGTPEAMMAEREDAANAASEVPVLPDMLVDLAAMYQRKVLTTASMRPTASTASVEVPQ